MTSTTDTAGHPDVTEISDLAEGLLPPERGTDVRRHLGGCELCADVYASLEEIRGLLGSAQAPEPMPVDVAQRIVAALAAEALLNTSGPDSTGHVSRETSVPTEHPAPVPTDRPADRPVDRPAGRAGAATGPGRKKNGPGRRRRAFVLGGVLTAAVLGAGALVFQSLGGGTSSTTAKGEPSASAGAFSGSSVQNQVRDLLATKKSPQREDSQRPRSGQNTPQTGESANTLLQPQVAVPECVRRAVPRGEQALAAKTGTYAGKSAYLVVLPDLHDSARVTAYVVDAACVGQQPVSAGKVLLKQPVARP
ncbi:anti-sigma factor family protein [Streptomyces griseofuscus]|uniref:anti-sigma factor family protein n=1 Tax=Streptomyces griseofuscus TaxID=146922 RepID=UPI0033F0106E